MWELAPVPGWDSCYLRNPTDRQRYHVEVSSPSIRPGTQTTFPVIDAGAQVKFDTLSVWGRPDRRIDVTWHNQQDRTDEPQHWSSKLPKKV